MSSIDIKQMMVPDFWKMISDIKWGVNCTSSTVAANKIKVNYPPYKSNHFKTIALELANELADKYLSTIRKCNHYTAIVASYEVIAKGRSTYEEFLKEPSQLKQIIESVDASNIEGLFIFAIPSEEDYYKDLMNNTQYIVDDEY